MLNYYDEVKNDILEVLEEDEGAKNILHSESCKDAIIDKLTDYLTDCDGVTGNLSGSYYCNSYKARKHCYNYFRDVFESLEECGYNSELEKFKTFVSLVEEGYLNMENMTLDYELLDEVDEDVFYAFEEVEYLDFEVLDVITRCFYLSSVLWDVLDNYLN